MDTGVLLGWGEVFLEVVEGKAAIGMAGGGVLDLREERERVWGGKWNKINGVSLFSALGFFGFIFVKIF